MTHRYRNVCMEKTQNQNESFNSTIWKRVPKNVFIDGKTFTLGCHDSVSHFTGGGGGGVRENS